MAPFLSTEGVRLQVQEAGPLRRGPHLQLTLDIHLHITQYNKTHRVFKSSFWGDQEETETLQINSEKKPYKNPLIIFDLKLMNQSITTH